MKTPLLPITLDDRRLGVRLQPPRPGEHSTEVLRSLGYDAAQIEALRRDKVVG